MTGSLQIAVTAVGGLALFIYGMELMSDGLKETAGSKLKAVLGYMTKNRFFAIAAGAGVTALIQSSSATSVMTVGFVNAGLLSLEQAIGVIFGANIGNVILLSAFIPALARICETIIRSKGESRTLTLEPNLLVAPALALQAAASAVAEMTRRAWTVASVALNNSLGKTSVNPESIEAAEREVDEMREQIKAYLVEISQRKLSQREALMIPELLHCANDAERISDLALKVCRKGDIVRGGIADPGAVSLVAGVAAQVRQFAHDTIDAMRNGKPPAFDPKSIDSGIRSAARMATLELWNDQPSRGAHTREYLALVSVFKCLGDISRHIGNIAVRARGFSSAV